MEIKERIIQGANDLFLKFGVKSITMDDIAKQLGISKKTIYQFFEAKDKLVSEVAEFHLTNEEKVIAQIAANSKDPIHEILGIMDHLRSSFQNMNPSLLYEIEKYFPEAWKVFLEHKKCCVHDTIVDNLKKGIALGLYRKEINVEIIAMLRMEEVQLGFNPSVFSPAKFNLLEVQSQLLDHFLHGICTIKGHKLINKYKQITEDE